MENRKLNLAYILTLPLIVGFVIWSSKNDKKEFRNDLKEMYKSQFEYRVLNKTKDYENHGLITFQLLDLYTLKKINFNPTSVGMGDDFFKIVNLGDTLRKVKQTNYFSIKNKEVVDTIYFNCFK